MLTRARGFLFAVLLLGCLPACLLADARFDLVGPKIDVRVTRTVEGTPQTLPIASVPTLQPGDKLWIHPDLPPSQSVKYLLICAFLRGTTNPPPESWFVRIETWRKEVRNEGVLVTVPPEAQQAVLFMAPETGGDFATLKSAVRGRPGVFVRASQDLNEAGFEQARIERYLADIRRVSASDPTELQRRSDLLARTLALKPNADCFKRPVDVQFTCLTQTGTQTLLDDGHGGNLASALSNGASSDLIQTASYTNVMGGGLYSAYVGAVVDLVRIMANLHTAQFQYIPAIAFPQGEALNLRLNTPPSFHNPKSVLVIGLPGVQTAQKPPLRPADVNEVACLLKPKVVLPIEGAPLVFSTDFATGLSLHLNTPPGAPAEPDIPLGADAFEGGLVLQHGPEHHVALRDSRPLLGDAPATASKPALPAPDPAPKPQPEPATLTGTIQGRWGFETFTGPTIPLQQLPGSEWRIVNMDGSTGDLIAGKSGQLFLESTGSACVHTITARLPNGPDPIPVQFKDDPRSDRRNLVAVTLPDGHRLSPGKFHLEIQQYGQPKVDAVAAQTFADPPHLEQVILPAGDKTMLLTGTNLASIQEVALGDLTFRPAAPSGAEAPDSASTETVPVLRLGLPADAPRPPTHTGDKLSAQVVLHDGRHIPLAVTVLPARPAVSLISRSFEPLPGSSILLSSPEDLPLAAHLTFTLKSRGDFPRNGRVEVETSDGTLRTVLTLAPAGGLVLQDPHTIVASLDPLRSFGPSAFGAIRLRAVFTTGTAKARHAEPDASPAPAETAQGGAHSPVSSVSPVSSGSPPEVTPGGLAFAAAEASRESDWIPLGTLVRLPTLTHLGCTADMAVPCNLTGANLFLIQSVSADPAFSNPDPVPDGFTANILPVPHPASMTAATLFLRLRDDPNPINAATLPTSVTTTQASTAHGHSAAAHN